VENVMSMSGFHFGDMDLNQDVIAKGWLNMNKTISDIFDNGLTKEEQAIVDKKYEELMLGIKKVDYKLYQKMQSEVVTYEKFMQIKELEDKGYVLDDDNQLKLI
jgi:hypothetical protein